MLVVRVRVRVSSKVDREEIRVQVRVRVRVRVPEVEMMSGGFACCSMCQRYNKLPPIRVREGF